MSVRGLAVRRAGDVMGDGVFRGMRCGRSVFGGRPRIGGGSSIRGAGRGASGATEGRNTTSGAEVITGDRRAAAERRPVIDGGAELIAEAPPPRVIAQSYFSGNASAADRSPPHDLRNSLH
jgi:hypothetical protein